MKTEPARRPFYQRWWFIALAALVLIGAYQVATRDQAPQEPASVVPEAMPSAVDADPAGAQEPAAP